MPRRVTLAAALLLGSLASAAAQPPSAAPPFRVFAAGSLASAFNTLLARFGAGAATYGPSGALRARIEKGEVADLFASADMAQPAALAGTDGFIPVVMFARNRVCAIARSGLGLTADNLLAKMLDPAVRLATSTPGSDPSGDYAWAVFDRAEQLHPGARAVLEGKAQKLMGAPGQKPLVLGKGPIEGIFLADRADIMLAYCSGLDALRRTVPDIVALPMPPALAVAPSYGLTARSNSPDAMRFALFVLSPQGQSVLAANGLIPVTAP